MHVNTLNSRASLHKHDVIVVLDNPDTEKRRMNPNDYVVSRWTGLFFFFKSPSTKKPKSILESPNEMPGDEFSEK